MMEFNPVRMLVAAFSAIGFVALVAGGATPVESLSMQPQLMRATVNASAASLHQIFVPSVVRDAAVFPGQQESEPNDDWENADGPLAFGVTYTAHIEGTPINDDSFYIDVPSAGAFEVAATGLPQYCLLLVYDEDLNSIGVAYLAPYRVQINAAAAGRYFVRVRVSDIFTSTEPYETYELRVEWQAPPTVTLGATPSATPTTTPSAMPTTPPTAAPTSTPTPTAPPTTAPTSTPTPTAIPTETSIPSVTPTENNLLEDNDDPCQATMAASDTTYVSYGDDEYDFFELNVPTTGTLSMTLGADVVTQLDLRSPLTDANCNAVSSTRQLAAKFIVANQANIQYSVAPGRYYARIRIAPTDVPNPARAYTFRWTLTPGSKPAKVCIGQDASIDDCAGDVRDNKLNIKWQGLNGNARIRLEFTGNSGGGGTGPNKCVPGSRGPVEFNTTDVEGARNVDTIPTGGYTVKIFAYDVATGAELYRNEQAVKVGCQFYRPAAAPETTESEFAP